MNNMARILQPFANDHKFYDRVPDKTMLFDAVPCRPTHTVSLIVEWDPSAYTHVLKLSLPKTFTLTNVTNGQGMIQECANKTLHG